jgi:hypothetical protein
MGSALLAASSSSRLLEFTPHCQLSVCVAESDETRRDSAGVGTLNPGGDTDDNPRCDRVGLDREPA